VKIEKEYSFEGPNGKVTLADIFEGSSQLIIYHFMLGPDDTEGCPSCSFVTDNFPSFRQHLHARNTTLALVSRAPLEKIEIFKKRMGWNIPWYSSFGSDFNYDFNATNDAAIAPVFSNWEDSNALLKRGQVYFTRGEQSAISVFVSGPQAEIYHTYSAYQRGIDRFLVTNQLLDLTPQGRGDNLPKGVKVKAWAHHDKYVEDE
jgi:predicted dithiol-disulfide oxidoreductase (DUF899 family)